MFTIDFGNFCVSHGPLFFPLKAVKFFYIFDSFIEHVGAKYAQKEKGFEIDSPVYNLHAPVWIMSPVKSRVVIQVVAFGEIGSLEPILSIMAVICYAKCFHVIRPCNLVQCFHPFNLVFGV